MPFLFAIRILKKRLGTEETLAARGADRFAPGRVKELKEAIEALANPQMMQGRPEKGKRKARMDPKGRPSSQPSNQLELFP